MRKDITVIIAAHKEYRMPEDPMYMPVHVGAALSDRDFGYAKDNTGENISSKNPSFCELTGIYWAWKNVQSDYIGLVHYRRYFSLKKKGKDPFENILTYDEIKPMLYHTALFVPQKRNYYIETLYSHYAHTHYAEQLDLTEAIIQELYPDYMDAYQKAVSRSWGYMFNMMIMRWDLFDEYCTWLFDILFELEKRYNADDLDAFQKRFYGRISEIIFNVWLEKKKEDGRIRREQIRELPFIYMEPVDLVKKAVSFLKAKFIHKKYERSF